MKSYNEFILENFREDKLKTFLKNTFSEEDYFFRLGKLHFIVRKSNIEPALKFFKTIEKRFRYYVAAVQGYEKEDIEDYKEFRKDLLYNLAEMDRDLDLDEDDEMITLIFEPILGEPFENVPDIIYHITDESFIKNIKKKGILPKTQSKIAYHPKRIYLVDYPDHIRGLISHNDFVIDRPYLLTIDISKVRDNYNFYKDINYPSGFFTTKAIPPELIIDYTDINSNYKKLFT